MRKFFYALLPTLAIAAISVVTVSCGSTWEISGNNMEINVLDKDTTAVLPSGTQVMCVDTPSGAMKCYLVPQSK